MSTCELLTSSSCYAFELEISEDDILCSRDYAITLCLLTTLFEGLICFIRPKCAELLFT